MPGHDASWTRHTTAQLSMQQAALSTRTCTNHEPRQFTVALGQAQLHISAVHHRSQHTTVSTADRTGLVERDHHCSVITLNRNTLYCKTSYNTHIIVNIIICVYCGCYCNNPTYKLVTPT